MDITKNTKCIRHVYGTKSKQQQSADLALTAKVQLRSEIWRVTNFEHAYVEKVIACSISNDTLLHSDLFFALMNSGFSLR